MRVLMIVASVLLLPYAASARAPRCTKPDTLFEATCDISEKVARVWGTLAPDNTESCRFQIWVDASGNLVRREVTVCENVKLLDRVLRRAAPFKVPCDPQLLEQLQGAGIGVN